MAQIRTAISAEELDVAGGIAEVSVPDCGGIAIFIGTVRSSAAGPVQRSDVQALEYDSHPTLAEQRLRGLALTAAERWDVRRLVAEHRSGRCEVGQPTLLVACSAPHRADALEACRWLIDEIKREVPIWKREIYPDGESWVGAGP